MQEKIKSNYFQRFTNCTRLYKFAKQKEISSEINEMKTKMHQIKTVLKIFAIV